MRDIYEGPGAEDLGPSTPHDDLIAGEFPALSGADVSIAQGQVLERGAVLGRITAEGATKGQFKLTAAAAADGSEAARVVLAEGVDTSAGVKTALVYLTGVFNRNKVIFGAGHTADSTFWDLADAGIQLRDTVRA
ncbi:MAG: head decoration protein [Gemmatimonadota bacterium]